MVFKVRSTFTERKPSESSLIRLQATNPMLPMFKKALAGHRRFYGRENERSLTVAKGLATLYSFGMLKQPASSRALLEDVLEIERRTLGDADDSTINTVNCLGTLLLDIGDVQAALALLKEADAASRQLYVRPAWPLEAPHFHSLTGWTFGTGRGSPACDSRGGGREAGNGALQNEWTGRLCPGAIQLRADAGDESIFVLHRERQRN